MGPREVSGKQKCECCFEVQSQQVAEIRLWRTLEDTGTPGTGRSKGNGEPGSGAGNATGNMEE